jgi:hypothetical protein
MRSYSLAAKTDRNFAGGIWKAADVRRRIPAAKANVSDSQDKAKVPRVARPEARENIPRVVYFFWKKNKFSQSVTGLKENERAGIERGVGREARCELLFRGYPLP